MYSSAAGKKSLMDRFLNTVETVGNKLPDPATVFIVLAVITIAASAIFGMMGVEAVHPGTHKVTGNRLHTGIFQLLPLC